MPWYGYVERATGELFAYGPALLEMLRAHVVIVKRDRGPEWDRERWEPQHRRFVPRQAMESP